MSEFSGIATATLRTWLTDAQTAMQSLALGKQTVAIATADGKSIRFTAAELPQLRSYIVRLQRAIAIADGTTTGNPWAVATWTR
jgi:hypothetical protein